MVEYLFHCLVKFHLFGSIWHGELSRVVWDFQKPIWSFLQIFTAKWVFENWNFAKNIFERKGYGFKKTVSGLD